MSVLLKLDNRECKCKSILSIENECTTLEFGDFQILINDNIEFIFERKTLDDLLASIKDGRYKNQKTNILASFPTSKYYYIIEGKFDYNADPKNTVDKIIQSSIINMQLRDKIGIFVTKNINETCELIKSIYNRIKDKPTEYLGNTNLDKIIITKKVKSIQECWKEQLCQVPDISNKTADAICKEYSTMKSFYKTFENLSKEEAIDKLSTIKTIDTNRKISSKVINNIINFILFNDI